MRCPSSPALLLLTACLCARAATYHVAERHPRATDSGDGSIDSPYKTISKAADRVAAGDVVVIHGGTYRERVAIKASGTADAPIRFEAAPGEYVLLTGADRMTGWQEDAEDRPVSRIPWTHQFIPWSKTMTHPGDARHRLIGRSEQVAVNGYLLRQVLEPAQLAPGTFFTDVSNQVLRAWDSGNRDLNKCFVEASVRTEVMQVTGSYVSLRGLRFQFAANMAQHGAVVLAGAHDTMEDCTVEAMNASGATFAAEDLVVRRCSFRDNGQLGFGANGAHRLLFTECVVENNNTKDFDRGWEAGGDKLVLCRDAVLERSQFVRNRGNGIWFDIGNEHCTVRNCLIADNEDAGIFYEISFGLQAHDNVITGNGFATSAGAWGAQAGIALSSSPDCVVERNLLVGNREGFNFREQHRTTPRIGRRGAEEPVWNHDQTIRHNVIAFNRDAQIWGWFDMKDNRHWPEGTAAAAAETAGNKPGDIAAAYGAKDRTAQPRGLTLETLRLKFEENTYFAAPGQGWFTWGVSWGRHKVFTNLAQFQAELAIDRGSVVADPGFHDFAARDFRVRRMLESYPRGEVPAVSVGRE